MAVIACILIICATVYSLQQAHYKYLESRRRHAGHLALIAHLEEKLKDIEHVKSKVDSLTLRAGFKL